MVLTGSLMLHLSHFFSCTPKSIKVQKLCSVSVAKLNMLPFLYLYFQCLLNCLMFQMVWAMTSLIFWTHLFHQKCVKNKNKSVQSLMTDISLCDCRVSCPWVSSVPMKGLSHSSEDVSEITCQK